MWSSKERVVLHGFCDERCGKWCEKLSKFDPVIAHTVPFDPVTCTITIFGNFHEFFFRRRGNVKNTEKDPSLAEEEDETNEEDDEDPIPLSSPSHLTNGHVTPFSSFSSDWNSHHSDEGVQLPKTTSSEDIPRLPGRLIITVQPQRPIRRRLSEAVPTDRVRRDSEEESSGILDDSEPENYPPRRTSLRTPLDKTKPVLPDLTTPRVDPKPWRRYSAIEQHHVLEPTHSPPGAVISEKPRERAVDVYNESPVDVAQLEADAAKPTRPSPPKQFPNQRATRRDTIPKREHFTEETAAEQAKSGKIGTFKNWLEKRVAPKKKSFADSEPTSPTSLSPQVCSNALEFVVIPCMVSWTNHYHRSQNRSNNFSSSSKE